MSLTVTTLKAALLEPRPVSVNKLYSSNGSKRFLTTEGRHFKDALTAAVAKAAMKHTFPWATAVDAVYKWGAHSSLEIHLFLEKIRNASWRVGGCMTKPTNKSIKPTPRSPYQKIDGTNYIKLIEDAVAAGTGIDDSVNLSTTVKKYEDPKNPRVEIYYTIYE